MKRDLIAASDGSFEQYQSAPLVADDVDAYRVCVPLGEYPEAKSIKVTAVRSDASVVADSAQITGDTPDMASYVLVRSMYALAGPLTIRAALCDETGTVLTTKVFYLQVMEGADASADASNAGNSALNVANQALSISTDAENYAKTAVQAAEEALKNKADKQTEGGGFVGGRGANIPDNESGVAIGKEAYLLTTGAGADGAAIGQNAAASNGGAVGCGAQTLDGFAGGFRAKTISDYIPIDAIQLGTGTNDTPKTMQVYNKRIVEADGRLTDVGRLSDLTTTEKGTIVGAVNELKDSKAEKRTVAGGFAGGNGAAAVLGGAIGEDTATGGGGAVGQGAASEYGGAVGQGAKASDGFAGGQNADATRGGAVGMDTQTEIGGAVGFHAVTYNGGAVGNNTFAFTGGAVGASATSDNGGAVGYASKAGDGGAVGKDAKAGDGFAGGMNAKAGNNPNGSWIDTIQLGSGTNENPFTLQTYNYQITDSDSPASADSEKWLKDVGRLAELSTTEKGTVVGAVNELHQNQRRSFVMTQEEYEAADKDPDTIYYVIQPEPAAVLAEPPADNPNPDGAPADTAFSEETGLPEGGAEELVPAEEAGLPGGGGND